MSNHGYNTPSKGTTDWNVPLNENFKQLETDVEIRDADGNKGQYEPKDGALFRATDTGDVYLGDGSNWVKHNPPSSTSSTSGGDANVIVAQQGEVQNAIDQATTSKDFSNGRYQKVRLESGKIYRPSSTWNVKRGVVLDFNGARVEPGSDTDIIHLHPETGLIRPYIDCRGTGYTSTVITLDGSFDGQYSGPNRSWIENMRVINAPGKGVGLLMHDSNGSNVSDVEVSGLIQGFDRAIDMRATGGSSAFVNANHFDVKLMNYRIGVRMRAVSDAAVNGNTFEVNTQPLSGTSEWLWDVGSDVGFNTFHAEPWDKKMYSNTTVWIVRSGAQGMNTFIDRFGILNSNNVVDNSGKASNKLFNYL